MNFWTPRTLFRLPKPRPPRPVVLYTRARCECCRKALDVLQPLQSRLNFHLETIDIDGDPELVAQYGQHVPVVLVDGKVRFRGQVNVVLFRRLLKATPPESGS
jgi:glutaredoxin